MKSRPQAGVLGQRRGQVREETQRIEATLAEAFSKRGFAIVPNWAPERAVHGDAGEVDLICALNGVVLLLEVKSTFVRLSQREAFQHATSTLRHAGRQVGRKVEALTRELASYSILREALNIIDTGGAAIEIHGLIVTRRSSAMTSAVVAS